VVPIQVAAGDPDGTVTSVAFATNSAPIPGCVDPAPPFICGWTPATPGVYLLTATATDNKGATTTSAAVLVTSTSASNQPPAVAISSPVGGANVALGNAVTIVASASDSDGAVTQVEFFANGNLLASCVDTTAPYECTWTPNAVGQYNLTALATDNAGATTRSALVIVTANDANHPPPTVTVISPPNGATVRVGQPVLITVAVTVDASSVAASLNKIVQVAFFTNNVPIAGCVDTTSPYQCTWTPTAAGQYTLTALATDDLGSVGTALAVMVTAVDEPVTVLPHVYLPLIAR
jgi:hypothetical protein